MSTSLVRRALQLVDEDFDRDLRNKAKKNKGLFNLIPANHQTVKKVGKGGKIEKKAVYNISESSSRRKKDQSKSLTAENLEKLKKLQGISKIDSEAERKILKRARTNKAVIEIEEEKPEESTLFTEEDFKRFEAEL